MLIYIVGMPASGKTTFGRGLAHALGYRFLDIDEEIVRTEKMSVAELFREKGESYFRKKEAEALRRTGNLDYAVVATGGGTPCFFDNMDYIREHGFSIFLDTPLEVIERRLFEEKRPLIKSHLVKEEVSGLYRARSGQYRRANLIVRL